ncbi:RHS repeat-associated core domain-containing protein [Actinokineospora sp. NPDC004072]
MILPGTGVPCRGACGDWGRLSMRHGWSRGLTLRVLSAGLVLALVSAVPVVAAPSAVAAEAAVPSSAWTPGPATRTVVGGAPPAGPAKPTTAAGPVSPDAGAASLTCATDPWGVLPDFPMERFRISDRLQFAVNLSDGNLWVDHRDLTVRGTGIHLNLHHSYSTDAFGGWSVNAGRDMGLGFRTGQVIMPTDSGACVEFRENPDGSYGSANHGVRARLVKNAGGSYTARFTDSGETWSFNAGGWPLNRMDRNGNSLTYYYNSDGSLASVSDSQGRVTTFTSDANGQITRITDPSGTVAGTYTFNRNNQLTEFTDRDGKTVRFTYSATSPYHLTSLVDQAGRTWSFSFDAHHRLTAVTTPRQAGAVQTRFAYDSDSQTTMTDPNGNKTVYTFDEFDRQVSAKDALGHTQSQTWTANSDLQSTTDGLNNSTTATYDGLDNLISTKLPTGATTTVGYTSTAHPNEPTSIKDPEGNERTLEYDDAGNVTKVRSTQLAADLQVRTYTGPKNLLETLKDANGHVTRFGYDNAGNLTTVTPPAPLGATRYTYDSLSRVTSVTDGNNTRIDYAYDRLDRVVAISSAGTTLQSMTYDAVGAMTGRSHNGVTTTFTHDTYPTGPQITAARRTQAGSTETVAYNYDNAGNLTSLTDPAGTHLRLRRRLPPHRTRRRIRPDDDLRLRQRRPPHQHRLPRRWHPNQRLRQSRQAHQPGCEEHRGHRAAQGHLPLHQQRWRRPHPVAVQDHRRHHHRLHLRPPPPPHPSGCRHLHSRQRDNITAFAGTPHTINAASQLTAAGPTTLTYDAAGRLNNAGGAAMTYSATDQLVRTTENGTTTFSATYDTVDQTQPRIITETRDNATTTRVLTHTALGLTSILDGDIRTNVTRDPSGRLITEEIGDDRYNLITDHQGSVLAVLNATGGLTATFTYGPYGRITPTGSTSAHRFGYNGGYTLRNGNILFGYRHYNPTWGRFTTPDPTGQETNTYAYAQADPVNNADPTGASTASTIGAGIGSGIGAIAGAALVAGCTAAAPVCAAGAGVMGAMAGGALGALGSQIAGGTSSDIRSDGIGGIVAGLVFNPVTKLLPF